MTSQLYPRDQVITYLTPLIKFVLPAESQLATQPDQVTLQNINSQGGTIAWNETEQNWYAFYPENNPTSHWLTNTVPAQAPAEVAPDGYWFPYTDRPDCIANEGVVPAWVPPAGVPGHTLVWTSIQPSRWYQIVTATGEPTGTVYVTPATETPTQAPVKSNKVLDWIQAIPSNIWAWLGEKYGWWRYLIMLGLIIVIVLCGWILLSSMGKGNVPPTGGSMAPDSGSIATAMANPLPAEDQAITTCGAGAIPLRYFDPQSNTLGFEEGFTPSLGTTYYVVTPSDLVKLLTGGGADTLESLQAFDLASANKWDPNSGPYLWRAAGLGWGSSIVNGYVQAKDWDNAVKDVPRALYNALVSYVAMPYPCLAFPSLTDIPNIPKAEEDKMRAEGGAPKPSDVLPTIPKQGAGEAQATTVPDPAISNRPAFEKYVAIVGEEQAKAAFTLDSGSQCYATITASWTDFTTSTPMTEVLRILGPSGFTPGVGYDFNFQTLTQTEVSRWLSVDSDMGSQTRRVCAYPALDKSHRGPTGDRDRRQSSCHLAGL